ncbi:hypothetical protein [Nonomuraea sp. NPDC049784]|uniref:hypothetical protein n=1 Tax=Nonomuraea sp. NPDC049784 TaxID=3154361 RepID=UPI0033EA5A95
MRAAVATIAVPIRTTDAVIRVLPNREYFHTRIALAPPFSTWEMAAMIVRWKFLPDTSRSSIQPPSGHLPGASGHLPGGMW